MDRYAGSDLTDDMQRRILAVSAAVFLLIAGLAWLWRSEASSMAGGVLLGRCGPRRSLARLR